jgi:hypothetical protein
MQAGASVPRERQTRREAGAQSHGPRLARDGRATERRTHAPDSFSEPFTNHKPSTARPEKKKAPG